MKKTQAVESKAAEAVVENVHPLKKSYMLVSNRHVDFENLTAFEAVSMSTVFVLAVIVGVLSTTPIV